MLPGCLCGNKDLGTKQQSFPGHFIRETYKLWDWVLRHRRQRTQLRSGHVGNSYSVKLLSLARTLQTLKVNYYFECLHLSQDCDIFTEALLWSSSTPGLRDTKPRLAWSSRTAMYVTIICFSIHCKIDNFKVFEELKKTRILRFLCSFCNRCQSLSFSLLVKIIFILESLVMIKVV